MSLQFSSTTFKFHINIQLVITWLVWLAITVKYSSVIYNTQKHSISNYLWNESSDITMLSNQIDLPISMSLEEAFHEISTLSKKRYHKDTWKFDVSFRQSPTPTAELKKLSIHIFAWKRQKALKRLLDSLLAVKWNAANTRFDGINKPIEPIPIVFHVDGDACPLVIQLIRRFKWPFGKKTVDLLDRHVGWPAAFLDFGWQPQDDNEYAILLEDDLEVSPLFYKWTLHCLDVLRNSGFNPLIVGCSYITPRVNEIWAKNAEQPDQWTPDSVLSATKTDNYRTPTTFLFQLPSSWGSLYSSKSWRNFKKWLTEERPVLANEILLGARSNEWQQSWKKYFIEYLYVKPGLLLYPNFPYQQSFVTNHYEEGIHSVPAGSEVVIKNQLRWVVDERFTVPLVRDERLVVEAIKHSPYGNFGQNKRQSCNIEDYQIVDVYHNKSSISTILQEAVQSQRKV